ncbi:envelope biogenesis factor ElyC [Oceaniserpentilla sp. 4NH20-0058]|uniref:envelope biogenesis factor ElyC n=1 Tax=Oceaniserpentilla sp. 4NH20-0058 TaxID=3127660 RepID=UPI00310694CB
MLELGFFIKKVIGFWLMPLSICVALLTVAVILFWLNKYQKLAKVFASLSLVLLIVFSWQPTSRTLLAPIENAYPTFNGSAVDYIVVLGNEVIGDKRLSPIEQLSSSARARLMEGLRIAKKQPNAHLIVSGYAGKNNQSCAEVYAAAAITLGIQPSRITVLSEPKDTHDEAIAVKQLVDNAPVALVTSASHMARAAYYFQQASVNTIPAPTFYLAKDKPYMDLKFNADGLYQSERAVHELIGQLWQRLKN